MPLFRVELDRVIHTPGERDHNPFLRDIWNLPPVHRTVRSWEFEAKDEAEVRKLLKEAIAQNLPNVRGFNLRCITEIKAKNEEGSV